MILSKGLILRRATGVRRHARFITAFFMAAGLAFWPGLEAKAAPVAAPGERVVVLISIDGLAGYYLDDPKAEMPTLRALATEGARASSMQACTPTVTWPNHTTLVTGVYPAKHGVVGNNYFDRATGKHVRLISDPVLSKEEIVRTPTIYDLAKGKGLKTGAIRWPASRDAKTLDWTIPDMADMKAMASHTTPALLEDCARGGIPFGKESKPATNAPSEVLYTQIFNLILREHRPNLALLHIIEVDHFEHEHGPRSPEAYAAIKDADMRVRQVWEELKQDFSGRATLFVVSDHGFSPIRRTLYPRVLLKKAGVLDSQGKGLVQIVTQGGSAMVYVLEAAHREELVARIREALAPLEGLQKILGVEDYPAYGIANPALDPHAPDLFLFGEEGCTFGDTADGDLPFAEKPERRGSHGHDPHLPDLHATFIAWGAGIKPGVRLGEISNTCVAPTIAKLLGLAIPNPDGYPLVQVLAE